VAPDEAFGTLGDPDADRDPDPDQHPGREHVLDEPQPPRPADQRELEARIDQLARDLHDRRQQDQEAPEDQRVHQPRQRPLEELALPQDLDPLAGHPAGNVAPALDRPAEADEPCEQSCPSSREPAGDTDHDCEDRGSSDH